MIIDLDDPEGLDPTVVGAKAAWLARGRRLGLPVLPGVVVPVGASRSAIEIGRAELTARGSGAARLAIAGMAVEPALVAAVQDAASRLGGRLVVRSSSPLEADGAWAGAFTSFIDVEPSTLATAIRGCWASAFANDPIRRAEHIGVPLRDLRLAILIQPAVAPTFGGSARRAGATTVVAAVRGSPAPLLQGWDPGIHGDVDDDGAIRGSALTALVPPDRLREVAACLRRAYESSGASTCEWAVVADSIVILQLGFPVGPDQPMDEAPAGPLVDAGEADLAVVARIARQIRHAPGALGAALVLPWLLGEGPRTPAPGSARWAGRDGQETALTALLEAIELADALTADAWREPDDRDATAAVERGRRAVGALRGGDPLGAARSIAARPAPDPGCAAAVHQRLATVRSALVEAGVAADADEAWHLDPTAAAAALGGSGGSSPRQRAARPRLDPWEPFQVAVILATGERRSGTPSGPGVGAGRLTVIDDARAPGPMRSRDVILARRPIPHLAPLLWDATAVITAGGGPAAHLFESARALGLPAVSGIGLDDRLVDVLASGDARWAVAVDGTRGLVSLTPW